MNLKKIIEYIISKIKSRPFVFDEVITVGDVIGIVLNYSFMLLRGVLKFRIVCYIGKNTSIKSKNKISLGSCVVIGDYCHINGLGLIGVIIGNSVNIGSFSRLIVSGSLGDLGNSIKLGNNVAIGEYSFIGGASKVTIGDNTIVGQYFSVHPENHNYADKNRLIRMQGVNRKGISVGENCWVGAKVTILDGSEIGSGCVIAAGSVVNGIFPNNVVIGGVPARILKER